MTEDPDERCLLDAIHTDPEDDRLRLVYADWLEERGDPRAEWVRAEIILYRTVFGGVDVYTVSTDDPNCERRELVGRLRRTIDPNWIQFLSRSPIPCQRSDCPGWWQHLGLTEFDGIRLCSVCLDWISFGRVGRSERSCLPLDDSAHGPSECH